MSYVCPIVSPVRKRLSTLAAGFGLLLQACTPSAPPDSGGTPAPQATSAPPPARGTIDLVFTYGSEKEEWLKEVTATFNNERRKIASGKTIAVQAIPLGSGECIDEL